jgi:adenylate cyclase
MEMRRHRLWHATREYLTHWSIAGAILAVTGAAPDHWFAEALDGVHLSREGLPPWIGNVDYRLVAVIAGLSIIVADTLWRRHGRATPADGLLPSRTPETQPAAMLTDDPPLPDKPSIAVLPFENMSGDPEQEYFSDGIANDITTELSHNRWLFVIARTSSFTYKNHMGDMKRVARELGVRYVLEGSVRRVESRVRISTQLIDARTANHIWAERYDRDVADVFAVQDEITAAVTGAIGPAIADAEKRRATRKPPDSLDAWEAYMRGLWHEGQGSAADHELAKQFFRKAIGLDAAFASPHSALAEAYLNDGAVYGSLSLTEATKLSGEWAQKAIAIDHEDADAQATIALAAMTAGNVDEARDHLWRAKASNPNWPAVLTSEEFILLFSGQPAQARQAVATCLRVDPRGPRVAGLMQHVAVSHYYERDYIKSVEAAHATVTRYPEYHLTYRWLAAALGQLGRTREAHVALNKAIELSPRSFDFYVSNRPPWHTPENYEHMLDGLRKAGWRG